MSKDYRQFCGLSRAAAVLGERWALLLVRDLTVGARRFTDLQAGLPGIPAAVLTARLRELEGAGIVRRAPGPARGMLYELTARGNELEPILDALGRWGALTMEEPRDSEVVTDASLAAALRSARLSVAVPHSFTVHVRSGGAEAWAAVHDEGVVVGPGEPQRDADLVLDAGPQLRLLLAGTLTPDEALASGDLAITGDRRLLDAFVHAFRVPLAAHSPHESAHHLTPHAT